MCHIQYDQHCLKLANIIFETGSFRRKSNFKSNQYVPQWDNKSFQSLTIFFLLSNRYFMFIFCFVKEISTSGFFLRDECWVWAWISGDKMWEILRIPELLSFQIGRSEVINWDTNFWAITNLCGTGTLHTTQTYFLPDFRPSLLLTWSVVSRQTISKHIIFTNSSSNYPPSLPLSSDADGSSYGQARQPPDHGWSIYRSLAC